MAAWLLAIVTRHSCCAPRLNYLEHAANSCFPSFAIAAVQWNRIRGSVFFQR
jgi:hypothetical protein